MFAQIRVQTRLNLDSMRLHSIPFLKVSQLIRMWREQWVETELAKVQPWINPIHSVDMAKR